jgi:uncharacterized protein YjeT (DUF2065 family)
MFRAVKLGGMLRAGRREDAAVADGEYSRFAGLTLVAVGLARVVVADPLLRLARRSYDAVLDVRFRRGETTTRRVRLFGFAMVLAGAHLIYHGGIRPSRFR